MKTISLCMIVKNEEKYLENCLKSVKDIVDEIIIVDTGSTDNTKKIAKQFTNKIFDFAWNDNFSDARNFSFNKASKDYILWLDADDIITLENQKKFLTLKSNLNGSVDLFYFKYEISFNESNQPIFYYYRERLLKNDKSFIWEGAVHEVIAPHGNCKNVDIAIQHNKQEQDRDNKRNLKIYKHLLKVKTLTAREQYYYARELYYNKYYKKCITEINKFLKDENGWIENKIEACEIKALCEMNLCKLEKAKKTLLDSFQYDIRPNILCLIGDIYFQENLLNQAIFYYKNALLMENSHYGFINQSYTTTYPSLQLCVCYYKKGDIKTSQYYNDLTLSFNPYDKIALKNKIYFENLKNI